MGAVLQGFTVIWIIIVVGFAIGRWGLLGPDARLILSRLTFFVASPCLLFTTISASPIAEVLGPQFAVAALSAFATLGVFLLLGTVLLRGRRGSELMIAGMGASLVNAANLGFPIAEYVLGDVRLAAPIVMFQLACYAPLYVMVMDQLTRRERSGPEDRPVHPRLAVLRSAGMSMLNPVIVASMLGLLFSWQGWSFPEPVSEAIELLAGASIPLMLLAFGLSLVGVKPLNKEGGRRRDVTLASGIKLLVHPAVAFLIAYFLFGLEGNMLLAAVIMGSLSTAQNVLVTAVRYRSGENIARDTVLVTTVLGIPSMVLIALLLA
ncbi:AEC family transporter [Nesterenkonia sp. NBAIMH1]|uniref:AEC family transporter n=1 Tax=Nesterenkonia sp. NBAIMH1 TaxID=2600320 RepID=UPI0011B3ABBD|nr:AEC family transporter [Nesterenkonia sp. NBAIMH1]